MDDFSFDAAGMDALTRDLGRASELFGAEVDKTMVGVGVLLADTAKKVAGAAGSSSIPPTIKFTAGHEVVEVRAGEGVPLAALWELGNVGKGGKKSKAFKHPVFGNRNVWVDQPRYPFLTKARRICRPLIGQLMGATFEHSLRALRGESE